MSKTTGAERHLVLIERCGASPGCARRARDGAAGFSPAKQTYLEENKKMTDPDPPTAPNEHCRHAGEHAETRNRSFGLNSEFYEAVCEPEARPWIAAGSLPREPRSREREVIVEARHPARRAG
jgi:hypothetical protein